MSYLNRCTCRSGRDTDGSEFGLCSFCEAEIYDEGEPLDEEDCWPDELDVSQAYKLDFDEDPAAWRARYWGARV